MKSLFVLLPFLGGLIIGNIILVDVILLKTMLNRETEEDIAQVDMRISERLPPSQDSCSSSCVSLIQEATASMLLASSSPSFGNNTNESFNETASSSVREYYISLGSGSNATSDCADVDGVQAYIDTTNYGKIKQAVFEATLQIPNGNQKVYARLFNTTDKHPVWFSEVSLEGSKPKLLTSEPITLDQGNKLYQVQMKTQLKDKANLLQSRIRILTY